MGNNILESLRKAQLVKTVRQQSIPNERLPFQAKDYDDPSPRALLMGQVAKVLEEGLEVGDNPSGATDVDLLSHRIAELEIAAERQKNIISAFQTQIAAILSAMGSITTSDPIMVTITRMEQLRDAENDLIEIMEFVNEILGSMTKGKVRPIDQINKFLKEAYEVKCVGNLNDGDFEDIDEVRPVLEIATKAINKLESSPLIIKHSIPHKHEVITETSEYNDDASLPRIARRNKD